jgi:hypothetical protein
MLCCYASYPMSFVFCFVALLFYISDCIMLFYDLNVALGLLLIIISNFGAQSLTGSNIYLTYG